MKNFKLLMKTLILLFKILAIPAVLFAGLIVWSGWRFHTWGDPKDLIKIGWSQADLRSKIEGLTAIELTESEVIKKAWIDGAKDTRYWIEVSFDPKKSQQIREMLLREGYEIPKVEYGSDGFVYRAPSPPPRAPKKISDWWTPDKLEKTTIFSCSQPRSRSYTRCFINEEEGILFIHNYST